MKVKYIGRRPRDVVPATGARGFLVRPGDVVEVDDVTGRSLLEQQRRWAPVGKPSTGGQGKKKEEEGSDGDA